GEETLARITAAKDAADAFMKLPRDNAGFDATKKRGFVVVGETLICFGSTEATLRGDSHTRAFRVDFEKEFGSVPLVSIAPAGAHTGGHGFTFGIFQMSPITTTGFTGLLNEAARKYPDPDDGGIKSTSSIMLSYVAFGPARK